MKILRALIAVLAAAMSVSAAASCHLFFLDELYSNADGSIQFVTLLNSGADGENFFSGQQLISTRIATGAVQRFTFSKNLPSNTANRHVLVATAGFAALGIVTPDFTIPDGFLFTDNAKLTYTCNGDHVDYDSLPTDGAMALYRGMIAQNVATNFNGDSASVVAAGPAVVTVVEYYNAPLDHYFITAAPDDIAALDAGAFPGWARTGQSFKAYAGPAAGLSPVCRFYIPPIHGDSHFFSGLPTDCAALLAWAADPVSFPNFSGYIEEHVDAFYVTLPDATGACPMNMVPVFRLWNQRFDSNHRYTTSQAVVTQMLARNYVVEGAQPNLAAMCTPM